MIVTPENYHTPEVKKKYMSSSQWKSWLRCPAATKAEIEGRYKREPTEAMLVGSYVDRALTSPDDFEAFVEENRAEIYGSKGKYAAFVAADAMIDKVKADPVWQSMAKLAKFQEIMEGNIYGEPWLYMADMMIVGEGNDTLLDLKTASGFDEDWGKDSASGKYVKLHWIDAWGYWRQLAVGRHLYIQKYGVAPVCGIIGVKKPSSKDKPVGLGLWSMTDTLRFESELARIGELTPKVMQWKSGEVPAPACGTCDYCLSVSTLDDEKEAVSGRLWTE